MIHALDALRKGFDTSADVIVVGTGAGGGVASVNLAAGGLQTVILEAGPQVFPQDMTRNAPLFMARYFWEGGLRLIQGSAMIPSMQGRCLGGSTVMNSAIMLKLPDWVRAEWIAQDGLSHLQGDAFDRAFTKVFADTHTTPTPLAVLGRRNLLAAAALEAIGQQGYPLPRAVADCEGCGDCMVGCSGERKQSTDRSYLPRAIAHGAQVYTCSQVEEVLTRGSKVIGVRGWVVDPFTHQKLAPFRVMAPRVVMCAGATGTPVLLQRSNINPRGLIGERFAAHLSGGVVGCMDEPVEPWIGATQGWGAISNDIHGMKFESLWAPPSVLSVRWGGIGMEFLKTLRDIRYMTMLCVVYRGRVTGRIKARRDGLPDARLSIPDEEARTVFRGCKQLADGLFKIGARQVNAGRLPGVPEPMTHPSQTSTFLSPKLRARHLATTGNHVFGGCCMSADPSRGPVDLNGQVRGVEGLFVSDASLFPSPSAVNPQATIMAMAELISSQIAELHI